MRGLKAGKVREMLQYGRSGTKTNWNGRGFAPHRAKYANTRVRLNGHVEMGVGAVRGW